MRHTQMMKFRISRNNTMMMIPIMVQLYRPFVRQKVLMRLAWTCVHWATS